MILKLNFDQIWKIFQRQNRNVKNLPEADAPLVTRWPHPRGQIIHKLSETCVYLPEFFHIDLYLIEKDTVSEHEASYLTYLLSMPIFGATDIRK